MYLMLIYYILIPFHLIQAITFVIMLIVAAVKKNVKILLKAFIAPAIFLVLYIVFITIANTQQSKFDNLPAVSVKENQITVLNKGNGQLSSSSKYILLNNGIIEETGVKIDIDDEGTVAICGIEQEGIDKALKIIHSIVDPIEVGKIYEGKVVRIMNFGAFVELSPNKDGLIHISKLSNERVAKVEDVVNIGDTVKVKVLEIDRMGKISLSLKDAVEE